jgi:hypothetical protein
MTMKRAGRDEQIVDVDDPDMLLYWSTEFEVEPARLIEAVRAVGNRADAIRDYVELKLVDPVKLNTAE